MTKKVRTTTINVLKWAIATAFFSMLMGCTVNLTEEGKFVRQLPPESTSPCEFLGVVEGKEGTKRNALNEMRNIVAEIGGNSYVPTQISGSDDAETAMSQVDAYRCP